MREPGFYWVRSGCAWTVAEWDGGEWTAVLGLNEEKGPYFDSDFSKVGPRITPPGEETK